jgi:hypothetical protein
METIKNYLESMFRGLPLTEKVMKAKSELLQMMEDKYTELIRSGKTENEAVGEVIQNFGNLEDLADDLGIKDILHETKYSEVSRRKLSFEEVTEYLEKRKTAAAIKAAGIMLCIICVIFPIMTDATRINDIFCVIGMFLCVGLGVILIISSHSLLDQWQFINREPCSIDAVSLDYLKNRNRDFMPSYTVMHSVGILLCILCFIPAVIFDEFGGHFWDNLSGAMLFVFVGFGVFLIVFSNSVKRTYKRLIGINDITDFSEPEDNKVEKIKNPTIRAIMMCYWPVVTCIYLCVSFLTFKWHMTWLIWPIAAAVNTIIIATAKAQEDNHKNNTAEKRNYED